MKISFEKRFLFIFLLIALSVITFGIIVYQNNKEIANSNHWVNHTHQVLYRTEKTLSDLKDIETGVRGYIITHDTAFLDPYYQSRDSVITSIQQLTALTRDNPAQQLRIGNLYGLAVKRIEQCMLISKIKPDDLKNSGELLTIIIRDGKLVMDKIRKAITSIEAEENRLLIGRENLNKENYEKAITRFYIFFGFIFFLFVPAYFFMRYNFSMLKNDGKVLFKLNERLQFLNKRFDDTIEGVSDPFFALDQNWKFIYLNTAAKIMLGFEGELIGKNIFEVFPAYKKSIIPQNMALVQQTREPISFEVHDDLLTYWQDVTIYPTTESVTVYIKDATKRKADEAELLKIKELLEETNELATVGGWGVDINKGTVYWTSVTRQIHETEPDYLPDLESSVNFYKKGNNRNTITELVKLAIENGTPWDTELQIITAKGNERWIRTKGKAEFYNGKCIRLTGTFEDIDEQKRLQYKLMQSEKQFRSAFKYSAIGMALVGANNRWKEVNESLCKIIGYSREELFKLTFKEITHPDDLEDDLNLLQELVEGKRQSYQLEKRYFHKDGHIVWILLVVSIVMDPDGNIVHFIAQIQDISEKKQAEKELLEERQLLKTIIDNIPLNVYLKDLESRKTLVNRSEMEYMGVTDEAEILGKNDHDLYPDDSALISIEEDLEVFKTGISIIDRETVSFKKDGTETWFLTSKIPFRNTQNEITGLLGISYDITSRNQIKRALQASEQKLSTLFDLSPVGFVLNDFKTGQFLEFNNSFIKNMGYTREEFVNLDNKAITPEEYWNKESEIHQAVAKTGYFGPLEKQYVRKDGTRFPVLLNGLNITDANGRELIWTVVQDITDLKLKEKELLHLNISIEDRNKELAVKNGELEQFAYVASHDLQEPLRMITGFLSKIEKKYKALLDDEGKKYIHFAVNGAVRMRSLITDILNYSSLSSDMEPTTIAVDLNILVEDIIKSQEEPGASIERDELPVINADKTSMQQLFSNLISNAIKYHKPGNKAVVKIKVEDREDHWKFSIADNGIGIDPKFFHKVFNVFQRLHNKEQYSGTGIGLAICKKIVNNQKGQIWLESAVGKGTTFYFTLQK